MAHRRPTRTSRAKNPSVFQKASVKRLLNLVPPLTDAEQARLKEISENCIRLSSIDPDYPAKHWERFRASHLPPGVLYPIADPAAGPPEAAVGPLAKKALFKWIEARDFLLAEMKRGSAFASVRAYAKALGMSRAPIETAINRTEELQKWRDACDSAPTTFNLSAADLAQYPSPESPAAFTEDEIEDATKEILKAASAEQREVLRSRPPEELRYLAELYVQQLRDHRAQYVGRQVKQTRRSHRRS